MSWTENKEKKLLYQWACQNRQFFSFQECMPLAGTYYCPFDNTSNVCSYGFVSIPEMDKLLGELWRDTPVFDAVKRVCAVAAFKRQPALAPEKDAEQESEAPMEIPDFIYIF